MMTSATTKERHSLEARCLDLARSMMVYIDGWQTARFNMKRLVVCFGLALVQLVGGFSPVHHLAHGRCRCNLILEMNGAGFDEKSQVSFILKSLSKSFLQFRNNAEMNKIEYNMTTLLNELQTFQSLKGQKEGEANVAHSRRYPKETKGGLFFDPQENKVFVSIKPVFLEEDHMRDHKSQSKLVLNEATDESTRVIDDIGPTSRVDETTTSGQSHLYQLLRMSQRSGGIVPQPNRYLGLTETQVVIPDDGVEDPLSYKQAMDDVDKDQRVKAMDLEMESIYFNSVWELVDLHEGVKPKGCKGSNKRKSDSTSKARGSKEQYTKTPQKVEDMKCTPNASTVGNLMYVMLCTRPDTCYAVGIVGRRTGDYMLVYRAKDLILTRYTDSDF
ncbi:gag/pol protein [Cucumis melo var. makuwa]|uniref:Gag/pol protein n=1 Tax=Cucumis melo var. makuwa TaxID=1194695 RepID=A0A5A7UUV8_CUCMM|nr:gag/pol protein [Cucumis melo var. makuwa]